MKTSTKIVLAGASVVTAYYLMKIVTAQGQQTKILNNLGQEWEPVAENIQPAVDASVGGWVKLPPNQTFTTSEMILLPSNTTFYGNNSTIKASDDFYGWDPYPVKNAVVCNANKTTGTLDDCSDTNIHVYDLVVDGNEANNIPEWESFPDQTSCVAAGYNWAADCHGGTKNYCQRNGVYNMYHCLFFKGVTNSSLTNCKFLHGVNGGAYLFYGGGQPGYPFTVKNCEFAYSGGRLEGSGRCMWQEIGLLIHNGHDWLVEDCTAHDCFSDGFNFESTWTYEKDPATWSHDWVARRCKAWNLWGGFWAESTRDGVFEDCEAWNCNKNEAYEGYGTGFLVGSNSFNIHHQSCYSHDNGGPTGGANFSCNGYHHITYDDCTADNAYYGFNLGTTNCSKLVANPPYPTMGYSSITNSRAYNNGRFGIISWGHVPTIYNNTVDNSQGPGIVVTCGGNQPLCSTYLTQAECESHSKCSWDTATGTCHGCEYHDGQEGPCKNHGCLWVIDDSKCYGCMRYLEDPFGQCWTDEANPPGGEVAFNTVTNWCKGGCSGWPGNVPIYQKLENVNYHDNTND